MNKHRLLLLLLLLLLLALLPLGCSNTWTSRRTTTDGIFWVSTAAYGLIQAQALTGTIPETMTEEEFNAEVQKADTAYTQAQVSYAQCLLSIETENAATYTPAFADLAKNGAIILQVKAKVCPVINKKEKEK